MIKHIYRQVKKDLRFITVTTRKANLIDIYFGKFTFWLSKQHYDKGNCQDCIQYTNIHLGNDKNYLEIEANKFIDKKLKELTKRELM